MAGQFPGRVCLLLSCALLKPVFSAQSQMCDLILEIDKERKMCEAQMENTTTGCSGTWDKVTCWPSADIDQVVTIPCPKYLFYFSRSVSPREMFEDPFSFTHSKLGF